MEPGGSAHCGSGGGQQSGTCRSAELLDEADDGRAGRDLIAG